MSVNLNIMEYLRSQPKKRSVQLALLLLSSGNGEEYLCDADDRDLTVAYLSALAERNGLDNNAARSAINVILRYLHFEELKPLPSAADCSDAVDDSICSSMIYIPRADLEINMKKVEEELAGLEKLFEQHTPNYSDIERPIQNCCDLLTLPCAMGNGKAYYYWACVLRLAACSLTEVWKKKACLKDALMRARQSAALGFREGYEIMSVILLDMGRKKDAYKVFSSTQIRTDRVELMKAMAEAADKRAW